MQKTLYKFFLMIICLGMIFILFSLANWQLNRANEKIKLEEQRLERELLPAVSEIVLLQETKFFLIVGLHGQWLENSDYFIPKFKGTDAYYEWFQLFQTEESIYLISKGLVPKDKIFIIQKKSQSHNDMVYIEGVTFPWRENNRLLSWLFPLHVDNLLNTASRLELNLFQSFDLQKKSFLIRLKKPIFPFIEIETILAYKADKHYGYAFQWAALAFAFIVLLFNRIYHGYKRSTT